MYYAMIAPVMISIVWIWPVFRNRRFWFGLALATLIGVSIWLAFDLQKYMESGGDADKRHVRAIHTVVSHTDIPVLQIFVASLITGIVCLFCRKPKTIKPDESSDSTVEDIEA